MTTNHEEKRLIQEHLTLLDDLIEAAKATAEVGHRMIRDLEIEELEDMYALPSSTEV